VLKPILWASAGLIAYAHAGYPLALIALTRIRGRRQTSDPPRTQTELPSVSLIIAAFDEEEVIADRLANARDLDYPPERLEVVVASDGSGDRTVDIARSEGADEVLDLPRAGKIIAQNTAAQRSTADILAFSDANSFWEADAMRELVAQFADPGVGYVCGQVRFTDPAGDNQEGTYWRYEMAVRELESGLAGVTAGNGAIYAVRRDAYVALPAGGSHDLSFPFELARRGLRSLYAPDALATEKAVPTLSGEWKRKRRMMVGLWDIVIGERMLALRGYSMLFAFQLISHRALRYATPFLHAATLVTSASLARRGTIYRVALALQVALLGAAAAASAFPSAPLRIARYYVLMTASIGAGLWDRLREGSPGTWEKAEGTRSP